MLPWVDQGLVSFIRTPEDFDARVAHEIMDIERNRFAESPTLTDALEKYVDKESSADASDMMGMGGYIFLSQSDEKIWDTLQQSNQEGHPGISKDEFLKWVAVQREQHPYFISTPDRQSEEMLLNTNGTSYESAKRICEMTKSHVITDNPVYWKELEYDHSHAPAPVQDWSPFAKALQNVDMKVLNGIPVDIAFQIRQEGRLENMRHFFNRVWRSCRETEQYSSSNAVNLAGELDHEVQVAQAEWDKIDQQLLKILGSSVGLAVATGIFSPSAAVPVALGAGVAGLAISQWKRRSFRSRFPAGFFLKSAHTENTP